MKKAILFALGLTLLCAFSCSGSDEDAIETTVETVTIASETRLLPSGDGYSKAYMIRKAGETAWHPLQQDIENFTYEEGHEYTIRLATQKSKADGNSQTLSCTEILSDRVTDSENLPAQSEELYLRNGYFVYKVKFETPSGKNFLDSIGVTLSAGNAEVLANELFDFNSISCSYLVVGGVETRLTFDEPKTKYYISPSDEGTVLTIMAYDPNLRKEEVKNVNIHWHFFTRVSFKSIYAEIAVVWDITTGINNSVGYDAYGCSTIVRSNNIYDRGDYSLNEDSVYAAGEVEENSVKSHRLQAFLRIVI